MNDNTKRAAPGFISADVVLGDARNNCAGQGICRVTSPLAKNYCSCIKLRAFLKWKQEGRFLSFVFPKVLIPHPLYNIYFGQGTFELPVTVKVEKEVLGTTVTWLKKGRYKVHVSSEFVEVQFACQPYPHADMGTQEQKGRNIYTESADTLGI